MRAFTQPPGGQGPLILCLMIAGGGLSVVILISKLAAEAGAPMLWFLAVVMALAGLAQLSIAGAMGQLQGWRGMLPYAAGAGVFAALPSAIGYLSVAHVGAGYVAMTFAFPILLTWVLARLLGMEARDPRRLAGVVLGLMGGVILAASKLGSTEPGAMGWVLLASMIPVLLAIGNIYRTRYWPTGARPIGLSALILLAGAALTLPFALAVEGSPAALLTHPTLRHLVVIDVLVFVVQYSAYLFLQRIGGPVTLSLMGPVAAVIGAPAALVLFSESLPPGFFVAAALVGTGVVLMLRRARPPVVMGGACDRPA